MTHFHTDLESSLAFCRNNVSDCPTQHPKMSSRRSIDQHENFYHSLHRHGIQSHGVHSHKKMTINKLRNNVFINISKHTNTDDVYINNHEQLMQC